MLRPQGKFGAAFGSYGWGECESVNQIIRAMERMKMEVVDSFKVKNVPRDEDLKRCVHMGKTVARAIQEKR